MKKLSLLFCLFSLLTLTTSCGDDAGDPNDPPAGCTSNLSQDFQAELTNINTATTNWANAQTEANCSALKDAYNDYLDALEGWEDCANFYNQVAGWQAAVDSARESVDNIC